ncbi:MAG: SRPBCC domain-containing protein [Chloroflexota bacterium]
MNNELIIDAPEGLPFLDYSREFDAPVSALFRAYTDREIFEQWFGPEGMPLAVHRFEAQTGGGFRYVVGGGDQEWGFHGVYHEIRRDELIIQTYQFEQDPAGGVSLEFQRFVELPDDRSRISVHSISSSVASRDALDGMRDGIKNDFDMLERVLARGIPIEA